MGALTRASVAFAVLAGLAGRTAPAQEPSPAAAPPPQTEADEYTRYELLAPGSGRFRILYEVTATTPGAVFYFNSIRKGSEASEIAVTDRASGRPLEFAVVPGAEARVGGYPGADIEGRYIRVRLPRPVPKDGVIAGRDKGSIQSCAARANIP